MKLLLDLGNSRWKWGIAEPGFRPGGAHTYDEQIATTLDRVFGALTPPEQIIMASVASNQQTLQIRAWLRDHWKRPILEVHATTQQFGVTNSYAEPHRLGADRWSALIAARHRVAGPVSIVDCGTAVTIDALDRHGVFRGGVILPGLVLQRRALSAGTHAIGVTTGQADRCLATNTADAVAAGTLHGLAGAIDHIVSEQGRLVGEGFQVLLTGGDATALSPLLTRAHQLVPDLVLEGLALIAETPS